MAHTAADRLIEVLVKYKFTVRGYYSGFPTPPMSSPDGTKVSQGPSASRFATTPLPPPFSAHTNCPLSAWSPIPSLVR